MRWQATTLTSLALLALSVGFAPGALGHAYLGASTPAPNGNVANGSQVLALRFTEVVDPEHTRATVDGPQGPVEPIELDVPADRPHVLRVEVPPLETGAYELSWTSFSIDSHVDRGRLAFTVGSAELSDPIEPQSREPGVLEPPLTVAETVGRLFFLVGALVSFGLPVYLSEVEPDDEVPEAAVRLVVWSGLVGAAGSLVLLGVLVARLGASTVQALGTLPGLFLVGKTLLLGSVAAIAARWRVSDRPRVRRRMLVAILPAGLALVLHSMGGHGVLAAASKESAAGHVAMTVHLAAGGLWLGGLVGLTATARDVDGLVDRIRGFTPLAVVSVVALGATGLVQGYVHLPSVSSLWSSGFGWALLAKTGLFALVLAFGAWHGFLLPDRLEEGRSDRRSFARSGRAEAVLLGGVVLAASIMGALPVPGEGVELGDGPRAVFEEGGAFPGYEYRVFLLDDPIRAGEPVPVEVLVRSTSSGGLGDASLEALFHGPGNRTVDVDLSDAGSTGPADTGQIWRSEPVALPVSGSWTLSLQVDTGDEHATEHVRVGVLPVS